jgi:hypothetical protein
VSSSYQVDVLHISAIHPRANDVSLQEAMKSYRKLQTHRQRLLLDGLAVATGLRPAFSLDYAPRVPVAVIERFCRTLSRTLSLRFVAWQWQGNLWVVHHCLLEARLRNILETQVSEDHCEIWALDFCCKAHQQHPVLRPLDQCQVCAVLPAASFLQNSHFTSPGSNNIPL